MSSSERKAETLHQICLSPSSSHFGSLFFSLSDGISSQIQQMMSGACERILSSLKAAVENKYFLLLEEKAMILTAHCPLNYNHFCIWVFQAKRKRVCLYIFALKKKVKLFSFCEQCIGIYTICNNIFQYKNVILKKR